MTEKIEEKPIPWIKVEPGSRVIINVPSGMERKYSRFAQAFHGRKGRVVMVYIKDPRVVVVDVAKPKSGKEEWIRVDRWWLSHDKEHPDVKAATGTVSPSTDRTTSESEGQVLEASGSNSPASGGAESIGDNANL